MTYDTEIRKILHIVVLSKDLMFIEGWLVNYTCDY